MNLIVLPVVVSRALTERCVDSLLAQDIGNVRLLIVDNGSTDGVGSWLRTLPLSQGTLITYAQRRGLNKVWNECLRIALDVAKLEHVLVVNNDVELLPETYSMLVEDGGEFITGVSVDAREQFTLPHEITHSTHPDFSCFLIRGKVWEQVGGFDEQMNAYCGDLDYHLRMHRAGVWAGSVNLPFLHYRSSTLRLVKPEMRDLILQEADRDRAYFQRKYGVAACSPEYEELFK